LDFFCGNGSKPCIMCAEYENTLRQPGRCNGKKNSTDTVPVKLRMLE
jgi:hypothetical protein